MPCIDGRKRKVRIETEKEKKTIPARKTVLFVVEREDRIDHLCKPR